MIEPTQIADPVAFAQKAEKATSTKALRDLLEQLPVVDDAGYQYDESAPQNGWRPGFFHWYPVGRDVGNAGRIKLAGQPENPLAERLVNGMEAIIELARHEELRAKPESTAPESPRDAASRYFNLPILDQIPSLAVSEPENGKAAMKRAQSMADQLRIRVIREKRPVEYAVVVEDDGIGQAPDRLHATLLSLGRSDKGDKQYLIGVFGQGGSSAYAASEVSWLMSRRAPGLSADDGMGWTAVRRVSAGPRSVYWAYLAAHPDGRVLRLPAEAANAIGFKQGSRIAHLRYNFGKMEPLRSLYQTLNHLLFKPVLPYGLYTRQEEQRHKRDLMMGTGYRLARVTATRPEKSLDKDFGELRIERKEERS